jgi:deoxycytidylate deaminase
VAAGIRRVYYSEGYSMLDGETILNAAGVQVVLVA